MIAQALKRSRSFRTFRLGDPVLKYFYPECKLSDKTGVVLVEVLKQNSTLRCFRIYGDNFSDETGVALAEALKHNFALRSCEEGGGEERSGDADALRPGMPFQWFTLARFPYAVQDALRTAAGVYVLVYVRTRPCLRVEGCGEESFDLFIRFMVARLQVACSDLAKMSIVPQLPYSNPIYPRGHSD